MLDKVSAVALRVSGVYALLAGLWILVSDRVLVALVPNPEIMARIEVGKGWAFVLVTAMLLFGVLRGQLRSWEKETAGRRLAEAYLAEAQRLSHTGSFGWKVATDEHIWSEETFRIFELDASTKITLPRILERIHPEDRTFVRATLERAASESNELDYEHRLLMPDGRVKHLHIVARCLAHDAAKVEFVGAVMDVTAQKLAQAAVRRSEAYLAEAQKLTHTGSWTRNPATGEFLYCSDETLRIFGWNAQRGLPTTEAFAERIHPDDRAQVLQEIAKAREQERDYQTDFRIVLPDGTMKFVQTTAHVVVGETGEVVEWFGTAMDVTDRKRAEQTLQEAQSELARVTRATMMGELVASIAHEVNQPLAGVVMSANAGLNWLAKDPPNLPKVREAIERVIRDGARAGEIIHRVRALLKKTAPTKSPVSVNQIIRDVLSLTGSELRQKNVELSLTLDSNLPVVMGDSIQLQQVLLNLIVNALEAMAGIPNPERTLRIRSGAAEMQGKAAIMVEVSDSGVGLGAAEAARLFEAFHTTKPNGMGMGLWISRSIVENHGGKLTAQPNAGPGATFQIVLPTEAGG